MSQGKLEWLCKTALLPVSLVRQDFPAALARSPIRQRRWRRCCVGIDLGTPVVEDIGAAQQKGGGRPGGVVVDVIKLTGTVQAVDQAKKTVTIEGSGGRTVTVNAKNVRNLDQVKASDKVNVEFIEEVALFVRKADGPPSATDVQVVELAPKGQKPAA